MNVRRIEVISNVHDKAYNFAEYQVFLAPAPCASLRHGSADAQTAVNRLMKLRQTFF